MQLNDSSPEARSEFSYVFTLSFLTHCSGITLHLPLSFIKKMYCNQWQQL